MTPLYRGCAGLRAVSPPSPSFFPPPYALLFTAAYATYGKRNHQYMARAVEKVREWSVQIGNSLRRSYDVAIGDFPCRTFNVSGQTVSTPHTDHNNLAHGWCAVTPLGRFDHKKGGHLALWDFGLAVEFPPGATILFPSALICHSNSTLQPGETRYSIVQYASGRIFRWLHNGGCTDAVWKTRATLQDIEARRTRQATRWVEAARSFLTLGELEKSETGAV